MTEDRPLIIDRGDVEQPKGLAGLLRGGDRSVPVPGPGQRLVLVGHDGSLTLGGQQQQSAGERHRQRPRSWLIIDAAEHAWTFTARFADRHSTVGFEADVKVMAKVTDPLAVASDGIESIETHLEAAVVSAVASAAAEPDPAGDSADPVRVLSDARQRVSLGLRTHLAERLSTTCPSWMVVSVASITVDFDETTKRHYDGLIERSRRGQIIDADTDNDRRLDEAEIGKRARWRAALGDSVANPILGLLEVAAADPSRENIAAVTAEVLQLYRESAQHGREVMLELIHKDFLDETHPLYGALTKELESAMPNLLPGTISSGLGAGTRKQLDAADEPGAPKTEDEPHTVDGEAHTQVGDWSDN